MRLGVNIDHVATLRNARGGLHPDPIKAAKIAEKSGADLIVAHLREDRRHINEKDVLKILNNINIPLQLEIAPTEYMFNFVLKNKINKVCIVPEKRQELTTEGGLDIKYHKNFFKKQLPKLIEKNTEVSLFLDPKIENIDLCLDIGISAIEFHTGEYANSLEAQEQYFLEELDAVIKYSKAKGISIRAGHGLNFDKTKKLIKLKWIEELNIGHFIIGESVFQGLASVVKEMKEIIKGKKI
jgi:pyridoxine 5-phosphate synthase